MGNNGSDVSPGLPPESKNGCVTSILSTIRSLFHPPDPPDLIIEPKNPVIWLTCSSQMMAKRDRLSEPLRGEVEELDRALQASSRLRAEIAMMEKKIATTESALFYSPENEPEKRALEGQRAALEEMKEQLPEIEDLEEFSRENIERIWHSVNEELQSKRLHSSDNP